MTQRLIHFVELGGQGVDTDKHPFGLTYTDADDVIDAFDSTSATYGELDGAFLHNPWAGYPLMWFDQYLRARSDPRTRDYARNLVVALRQYARQHPNYELIAYIGNIQNCEPLNEAARKYGVGSCWWWRVANSCTQPVFRFTDSIAIDMSGLLEVNSPGALILDRLRRQGKRVYVEPIQRDPWQKQSPWVAEYRKGWLNQRDRFPMQRTGEGIVCVLWNELKTEDERRAAADEVIAAGHSLCVSGHDLYWARRLI
ncbi:MAG: hypothetical protein IT445_00125 [Phycisphaeraceae bacterium]|nr:hypothetical protein [Phycisphaeraceae bacterium]